MQQLETSWLSSLPVRDGVRVAIVGRPNVGKSTLLNRLLGYERAIVTEHPGTTRDTVEEDLIIDGYPFRIVDTAGIRTSECQIERHGIERALSERENADLVLYVVDASREMEDVEMTTIQGIQDNRCVVILNKTDLGSVVDPKSLGTRLTIRISLLKDHDVSPVRSALAGLVASRQTGSQAAMVSERNRVLLSAAISQLRTAIKLLDQEAQMNSVLVAAHVREALEMLDRITGRSYSDELLNSVFSRFCVGK